MGQEPSYPSNPVDMRLVLGKSGHSCGKGSLQYKPGGYGMLSRIAHLSAPTTVCFHREPYTVSSTVCSLVWPGPGAAMFSGDFGIQDRIKAEVKV